MPVIFDTGALVRPAFTAADFTATKWDTSDDKAKFANDLCRFMANGFKPAMFTEKMYRRLAMTFGHIAHFDRLGFLAAFFENRQGKVAVLEQTLMWCPCGDPAWTWSDVGTRGLETAPCVRPVDRLSPAPRSRSRGC